MVLLRRALARIILPGCLALIAGAAAQAADWQEWAGQHAGETEVKVDQEILDKYNFELKYADGSGSLSFKDLAESGKPFVLVWWLSDCPVCHMQLPYVQKLQNQVNDAKLDVRVVSICIDQDPADALSYVRQKGITFDVLSDPRGRRTDQKFRVKDMGTPVTYVFGKGATLKGSLSGYKQQYSRAVFTQLGIPEPTPVER
jgi:thiol-disulfide isomerase/thioredoxin